ncbi:hypothetical protein LI951_07065 [Enterococcus sp. BWT-B8]|uniref:hypothetical protein n=1 Tax=unclassified Enterococcus TaxID=2608891 RepID=UPI001E2B9437|nr:MULTISPECIES: hypothetical protein [unclassified Enterococcus]MCB5951820.1 hypothetical protein [Enterococcus sp. BWT-B8]MCB5954010.1 hypothetical protein [Enterococcus sp. CWB-B31]
MADYCLACENLKEYAANFIINGITGKECSSLQKDTGLNPDLSVLHTNCEDLNDLNDCLIGALGDTLASYDVCDWKEFMEQLMTNLLLVNKAMICSECGQWVKIHELEDSIEKLWKKMAQVESALDGLAAQNWEVNARYNIEYSTPGMNVSIDRSTGNFVFNWSDWLDGAFTQRLGRGSVTGTVNFGMGQENGLNAKWQIRSVTINTCSYTSDGISDVNTFVINLFVKNSGEQLIYQRTHRAMTTFTDTINKTVPLGLNGALVPGQDSGWIQFFEVFNDNVATTMDDLANVQIQFVNANQTSVPPYI